MNLMFLTKCEDFSAFWNPGKTPSNYFEQFGECIIQNSICPSPSVCTNHTWLSLAEMERNGFTQTSCGAEPTYTVFLFICIYIIFIYNSVQRREVVCLC